MGDCATCPAKRTVRLSKQYRTVPSYPTPCNTPEFCYPKPARCSPFYDSCYPREPCQVPCGDTRCCKTDSGFLYNLRNGFQKMFTSKKKPCEPLSCGRVYNYSTSQLKYMSQCLDKLEEETCCIDGTIKEALNNNCRVDCGAIRCSVATVSDQVDGMRCDLMCAYECYDPYRDRCEYDLICNLLERTQALDAWLNDICLQLECMESYSMYPGPCTVNCQKPCCVRRPPCKPNCKKPCCYPCRTPCDPCRTPCDPCRTPCEPCRMPCDPCGPCADPCAPCVEPCDPYCSPCGPRPYCRLPCDPGCKPACAVDCRKPCCAKPRRWRSSRCPKPLCRTSSVIPVGVMLVKL